MSDLMCAARQDALAGDSNTLVPASSRRPLAAIEVRPNDCPFERAFQTAPVRSHSLAPVIEAKVGVWRVGPCDVVDATTGKAFVLVPLEQTVDVVAGRALDAMVQTSVGDIFVVANGTPFRLQARTPGAFLGMVFDEELIRMNQLPVLARYPGHYELRSGVVAASPLSTMLAHAIDSELLAGEARRTSLQSTLILALLEAVATDPIFAERRAAASNFTETAISRAMRHIDDNLNGDLSLRAIARAAGVSAYHLSRSFSAAVGTNLYGYIRRRRVQAACVLLAETRLTLAELAFECGFSSQSAMNTMFRKLIDCTPLQYRNRAWRRTDA